MLREILRAVVDYAGGLAAPALCPVCGRELLDGEHGLCLHCLAKLPRCITASRAALTDLLSNAVCPPGIAAAWFRYDPSTPEAALIRKAKYDDRPALIAALGRQFARELTATVALGEVDVLLPVPMHWRKRMKRGYNQSAVLAEAISRETGIPVGDNLVALAPHGTQTRRRAEARRLNMEGKLGVEAPQELDGLNIVIVDDIVTTGATVLECVRAVSRSGALPASMGVLSLALAGNC